MQELSLLVAAFKHSKKVDFAKIHNSLPLLPHLDLALSRSNRSNVVHTGYESVLAYLLGLKSIEPSGFPTAAYTYLLDVGESKHTWYVRADPVCLQPDRDRVVMVSANLTNITMADAQAISQEINHIYRDEPWQFVTPHPQRWYILLQDDPCIETAGIDQVMGQNIDNYLPTGPNHKYWRSILNEIQMLLHSHSVNEQRSSQDLPSINSLWLWGDGTLPEQEASLINANISKCDHVWSNDALCKGVAKYHNITCLDLQENGGDWLDSCKELYCKQLNTKQLNHGLVIIEDPTQRVQFDLYEWLNWLSHWQDAWLKPLLSALKSGQIEKLNLHFGNGQMYSLSRSDLKKWWRFKRPWYSFK